ncbi:outer membrane protein OmpA-like peptidoglycan-associated protein [Paraburkholderia bannensis]|uniref:Outer membrane protein OmpA-like peptidoglycan-associated protein n=1 Tax=Paraburkholderia bannensis TaxID=765414 RepID=A0A7W9WX01_9BURK|nr:OmpA family protein [Paraburkholderia bannensis]MBB6107142.1 outer membrane protein OmpA-like peptidoglycan-associated protein [Paraburkholderia bannensis]
MENTLKKLFSLATSISVLALLPACAGLDRSHELALNQATGIEVTQGPNGVELRLPEKVLFDFNRSDIRADATPALARAVVLLKRSEKPIIVEGHTDNVGTHEYNMQLSEARATTVADALETRGIAGSRVTTRGFAYDHPVAGNDTPEGQAKNRRTEIVIVGESETRIMGK